MLIKIIINLSTGNISVKKREEADDTRITEHKSSTGKKELKDSSINSRFMKLNGWRGKTFPKQFFHSKKERNSKSPLVLTWDFKRVSKIPQINKCFHIIKIIIPIHENGHKIWKHLIPPNSLRNREKLQTKLSEYITLHIYIWPSNMQTLSTNSETLNTHLQPTTTALKYPCEN